MYDQSCFVLRGSESVRGSGADWQEIIGTANRSAWRDHHDTLWTTNSLANSSRVLGHNKMALDLGERAFELRKAKQGADHEETLRAMAASWLLPTA